MIKKEVFLIVFKALFFINDYRFLNSTNSIDKIKLNFKLSKRKLNYFKTNYKLHLKQKGYLNTKP